MSSPTLNQRAATDPRPGAGLDPRLDPRFDPRFDVVVAGRVEVADGVVALTLAAASGAPLPAWEPGAHVDVELPGTGITRQYSLCGTPGTGTWRIAVLRDPASRGGSSWLHDHAAAGAHLTITGLRNDFRFPAGAATGPVVLVAGGIGITPLLAMARAAVDAGTPCALHYAGHSRAAMAFLDELAPLGDAVTLHVSDQGTRMATGELIAGCAAGTTVYACGPPRLLDALADAAAGAPVTLRTERFRGLDVDGPDDVPFEVSCARSGVDVTVPAGCSILAALAAAGIEQVSQCQEGVCGTCETTVLDGEPDHRDTLLTDEEREEGGSMMICVSRARSSRLVLDL